MIDAEMLAKLGIVGIDPTKLSAAMQLIESLGDIKVDPQELKGYFPDTGKSLYMPDKPQPGWYYDGPGLRKLTTINPKIFKRLLGI